MALVFPNPISARVLHALLSSNTFVNHLYPLLTPQEALALNRSVNLSRPATDYSHCDCSCQSGQPNFQYVPHNDFSFNLRAWFHSGNAFVQPVPLAPWVAWPCPGNNSADYRNTLTGMMEPSFCEIPWDQPVGPLARHNHANRPFVSNEPLVCLSCKHQRRLMWDWLKENFWYGVCVACRDWVVQNYQPGENGCICPTLTVRHNQANNGELWVDHMCHHHSNAIFEFLC